VKALPEMKKDGWNIAGESLAGNEKGWVAFVFNNLL